MNWVLREGRQTHPASVIPVPDHFVDRVVELLRDRGGIARLDPYRDCRLEDKEVSQAVTCLRREMEGASEALFLAQTGRRFPSQPVRWQEELLQSLREGDEWLVLVERMLTDFELAHECGYQVEMLGQ